MKHLDLFSGIGGFALAARWMGWEIVQFVEIDNYCQKVLSKNFKGVPIHGDIKTFDGKRFRGTVDILTGGFPCQPYSACGLRKGKQDDRHLWPEMLRVIREIRPKWVVGENVVGLLNWNEGLVFEEVQADLEAEGYEVQSFILPACAVNADHQRERIWIIAYAASNGLQRAIQKNAGGKELYIRRTSNSFSRSIDWEGYDLSRSDDHLRRDNGVPNWMDRIKGLGNAVVPQVVFEIFKAIDSIGRNEAHRKNG
jgi:DNA-cytosine methyltransferase